MRETDIHNLIEQQDPQCKQRIWKKILSRLQNCSQTEYSRKDNLKLKDEAKQDIDSKDF